MIKVKLVFLIVLDVLKALKRYPKWLKKDPKSIWTFNLLLSIQTFTPYP